jgi:hypothetical protein
VDLLCPRVSQYQDAVPCTLRNLTCTSSSSSVIGEFGKTANGPRTPRECSAALVRCWTGVVVQAPHKKMANIWRMTVPVTLHDEDVRADKRYLPDLIAPRLAARFCTGSLVFIRM